MSTTKNGKVVDIDGGPRVPKDYRFTVQYLAETQSVPMSHIYQDALDMLVASIDWDDKDVVDYMGNRAAHLAQAMRAMKARGIAANRATQARRRRRAA